MLKRSLMILLGVVIISTVLITAFAISDNNKFSNNIGSHQLTQLTTPSSTNITNQLSNSNKDKNQHVLNHFKVLTVAYKIISPSEAQKIATNFIEQPGAFVGEPKLVKQDNKKVYIVPVVDKSKNVGEIYIDAHNGKNLGGAGGAPS